MTLGDRCDHITALIDEVLGTHSSGRDDGQDRGDVGGLDVPFGAGETPV